MSNIVRTLSVLALCFTVALLAIGCDDSSSNSGRDTMDGSGDSAGDTGTDTGDVPTDTDPGDATDTPDDGNGDATCPDDRVCGTDCCATGNFCVAGQCQDTCASNVTCGATGGLCCEGTDGCRDDNTCGLVCTGNAPTCGTGFSERCCDSGEVCNTNGICVTDCGANPRCTFECCGSGEMCYMDACVADCDVASLCGANSDVCCGMGEVCLGGATCLTPGSACTLTEECAITEYCEPTLGACVPRSLVEVCEYSPPPGPFEATIGCSWLAPDDGVTVTGGNAREQYNDVVMTPAVANLTDDNTDGLTNTDDVPDIAFISFAYHLDNCCTSRGVLRIVSGECNPDGTMNTIFSTHTPFMDNSGGLAVANLHNDMNTAEAAPEIVGVFQSGGTIAWRRTADDGSAWEVMWQQNSYVDTAQTRAGTQPSIADLDNDGNPEVIVGNVVLNGQDGSLIWDGDVTSAAMMVDGGVGNNAFLGPVSVVSDLDLDGFDEVIAGNTVYDGRTGAVKAHYDFTTSNSACGGSISCDGYVAIGDFDNDPEGEVVIVRLGEVFVLDHTGNEIHRVPLPTIDCPFNESGPPTVADFDGDGRPEIGTASADYYVVVDFDCTGSPLPAECDSLNILWKFPNNDCSSRATGSSVFDFDGDGSAEVVYADERNFRVFDGRTGAVLLDDDRWFASSGVARSNTRLEMPIVVDVDNDGKAEILIPNAASSQNWGGIDVWQDETRWVRTRRIWNQHSYHVTNVTEDGQIPRIEDPNWTNTRLNNFRQNVQPGGLFDAPDLLIADVTVDLSQCSATGEIRVTVTVENNGALGVPAGVDVTATVSVPMTMEIFSLGVLQTSGPLLPGQTEAIVFTWTPPPALGFVSFNVDATVDDDGMGGTTFNECDENNNAGTFGAFQTCSVQ